MTDPVASAPSLTSALRLRASRIYSRTGNASRLGLILGLAAFAFMLHWTYEEKISPHFSYLGLRYRDPSIWRYMVVFLLVCALGLLLPWTFRRASDFILWVMFILAVAPSMLLPQYADVISRPRSFELAMYIACSFAMVVVLAPHGPSFRLARIPAPPVVVWALVAAISICVYAYIWYTTGLGLKFVSLASVRDIRFEFRDQIANHGRLLGYLVRVQGNVINPLIIARGVYSRRWLVVGLGIALQLPIFAATGFRMTLLSSAVIIGIAVLFRLRRRPPGWTILAATMSAAVFAIVIDGIRGGILYTEVFVDRLLITPGVLTAAHVEVFREMPKALWGYSFMASFVDYPYDTSPAFIVGREFTGDASTSSNGNLFADGYANLGYAGMFIEAAFLVLVLWAVNAASRRLPIAVSSLILLVPTLALVNSSAFTSVLTDGYAAAILLMVLLPRDGWGARGVRGAWRVRRRGRAATGDAQTGPGDR